MYTHAGEEVVSRLSFFLRVAQGSGRHVNAWGTCPTLLADHGFPPDRVISTLPGQKSQSQINPQKQTAKGGPASRRGNLDQQAGIKAAHKGPAGLGSSRCFWGKCRWWYSGEPPSPYDETTFGPNQPPHG